MRKTVAEALLILPKRGLSPKGQVALLKGEKIPTIPCLAPGQRPQGAAGLAHSNDPPQQGQGYSLTPGPPLPQSPLPLLHCHLSHTGKCLTLFDGCGFPRRQWCTQGQKPTRPPLPGGVWSWSGDFRADNLLGAPLLSRVEGNWRGQDILCDAPECTPHQTKTKRAPFEKKQPNETTAHSKITYLALECDIMVWWIGVYFECMCADSCCRHLLTHLPCVKS